MGTTVNFSRIYKLIHRPRRQLAASADVDTRQSGGEETMFPRTKALILAGGLGTRLRPLTDTVPKCLLPIGGRALLDYWVNSLVEAGISEGRINTHAHAEQVRRHIGLMNADSPLRLTESFEPRLLGSAGTVTANVDLADDADAIVVIYADNLSDIDLRPLLAFHFQHDDPVTMLLFRAPNPRACGIAEMDQVGRIVTFVEKPEQPLSDMANAGVYVVNAAVYREIAAMGAFDIGFDVLPRLVGRMRGWIWGGYYLDIGTHESLDRARNEARTVFPDLMVTSSAIRRPAVFLDRDGTMIEHVHYLSDPSLVRRLPGVAEALRRFYRAGVVRVVVTNQSAIGRGMLTEDRLGEIHNEMKRQLAACGATVDAIYHCPDAPSSDDRTVMENHDRKPGPGMLLRAAVELNLDLNASWMVGDLVSDVLAGKNAGCRSILLESGQTTPQEIQSLQGPFISAPDLAAAADLILEKIGEER
jgi:histidinol-phosphate phosphatase family protein